MKQDVSYVRTAKARMRETILDAAYDLVVAHGWGAARMTDIAARVGLSRQTLYNEFGTKDGLAREVVLREIGRFLDGITRVLDEFDDKTERGVEESVLFTLHEAADNPLLKAVLTASIDDDLLPLLTTRSEPVLVTARSALAERLRQDWPTLPDDDVVMVTDSIVRLTVSHLVQPLDPPDVVARRLARLVHTYLTARAPEATSEHCSEVRDPDRDAHLGR
jgi:AcrR family transcriptional regulator